MKLSVMLFPFHASLNDGRIAPEQLADLLVEVGATGAEPMLSWLDAAPGNTDALAQAVRGAGLTVSCLDIGVNLVGTCPADREAALDTVERGVMLARDRLGCSLVLLAGTRPDPALGEAESRRVYGDMLARAAERTNGSGVALTIEDFGVYPTFAASARHCLEVLKACAEAEVGFTFDNGNFVLADDDPTAAYAALRDRTRHVHIKDFVVREPDGRPSLTSPSGTPYRSCELGAGAARAADCVRLLKRDGYGGWYSFEGWGADPAAEVRQGIDFMRRAYEA